MYMYTCTCMYVYRNKRELTVSMDDKESTLPFDYLVITTGTQYSPDRPRTGDIPSAGVVSIKGDLEDKHCLEDARALIGIDGNQETACTCMLYMHAQTHS